MRLIDADELKALYDDPEFVGEKWHVPIRVILANIDDMPTIDPPKELICSVNVDIDEIIERIKERGWKPMTHETAIDFLLKEGWLQEHDRILTEGAVKHGRWNNHEVACLIADLFGDPCACNFNGIDEWLPTYCDFSSTCCPHPDGVACWEQYLKHLDKRHDEVSE